MHGDPKGKCGRRTILTKDARVEHKAEVLAQLLPDQCFMPSTRLKQKTPVACGWRLKFLL